MPDQGDVSRIANQAEGHPVLQFGARVGYAVSGVLHLLIAWIALQIAWFSSSRTADESGALRTLARNPLGRVTLWVVVLGFLALGLWQLANALARPAGGGSSAWTDKARSIGKAVVYLALAWTSFNFAKGESSSSKAHSADFTATLLEQFGGRLLVCALGVAVIGVGGYHVRKGWTRRFLQDLREHPGTLVTRAGVVGYIAQGTALGVVGVLFVVAAVQDSSRRATGLDGALRSLLQQPFGPWLLTAVGLGIAAFGIYSLARARYERV